MIRAAIVGLGRWGKTLVDAVQGRSERLCFTHAVGRDPERVRGDAAARGLAVAEFAAVLADPAVDAVVLATPHSRHLGEICAAAAAGKAVFCEKPLTLTKAEALRAVAACRDAGVVLGIGHDKRYYPSMIELARLAASGELGPILHLEANFSNEVAATQFTPWRDSERESPAGGLTGTGIHMLDALVRMAGPVRRVQAQLLSQKPAPDPHDTLSVILEFASGASGLLAAVRSTPTFWRAHVFGRHGSAEAIGRNEIVVRKSGAEPERRRLAGGPDPVRANLEAFAAAVAGEAPYPVAPEAIVATVAAFDAIVRACAKSGAGEEV
jgi:predicted dehydrogenase